MAAGSDPEGQVVCGSDVMGQPEVTTPEVTSTNRVDGFHVVLGVGYRWPQAGKTVGSDQNKRRHVVEKKDLIQSFSFGVTSGNAAPSGQNGAFHVLSNKSPKSKPGTTWGLGPSEEEETHQGPHSVMRRFGNRKDRFETW